MQLGLNKGAAVFSQPLVNVDDLNCPTCHALGKAYTSSFTHDVVHLEDGPVRGEYARVSTASLELSLIDVRVVDDMTLAGGPDRRSGRLAITCCLEGGMRWKTRKGAEIALDSGEMLTGNDASSGICHLKRGQIVRCVDLAIGPNDPFSIEGEATLAELSKQTRQSAMPLRIRSVVAEILDGRPIVPVRCMYCQGKAHELLALVLEEVFRTGNAASSADLPPDWTQKLLEARRIIDADIANAPTLAQLSRHVCLNEYKLKTGFKKMFGLPVHAYVINRRLESAFHLLQKGETSVTEAAHQVGYMELGRFAGTFKKKYGLTPSEMLKGIQR